MRADRDPMTWMDADAPALGGEERSDEAPRAETGQARRAPDPEVVAKPTGRGDDAADCSVNADRYCLDVVDRFRTAAARQL